VVALLAPSIFSGCDHDGRKRDDSGYLEVRSSFDIRGGDTFSFGGIAINKNASGRLEGLIKAPPGSHDLSLMRDARAYIICSATIRKNRVVSILLQNGARGLSCNIKD
jgi:hypothetical protein